MVHILTGYDAYLNLGEEKIARAPIIDVKSNLEKTQDWLDMKYVDSQCDTFKIDNELVITSAKIFTDMDADIYVKQRKSM